MYCKYIEVFLKAELYQKMATFHTLVSFTKNLWREKKKGHLHIEMIEYAKLSKINRSAHVL